MGGGTPPNEFVRTINGQQRDFSYIDGTNGGTKDGKVNEQERAAFEQAIREAGGNPNDNPTPNPTPGPNPNNPTPREGDGTPPDSSQKGNGGQKGQIENIDKGIEQRKALADAQERQTNSELEYTNRTEKMKNDKKLSDDYKQFNQEMRK